MDCPIGKQRNVPFPISQLVFLAERGVVLLGPLDFSAGTGNGHMITLLIVLHQDGPNASGLLLIPEAGICDEVEGVVFCG